MMVSPRARVTSGAHDRGGPVSEPNLDLLLRRRLEQGLEGLGLALGGSQQDLLIGYLALLVQWNAVYNLTAVREPAEMLALHLLDSLAIADLVGETRSGELLDVGTGAGLPGIPLAIAFPERQTRLVDAVSKKISYLLHVKVALKLANIEPQHARIEALTLAEAPSCIVSRAYSDLTRTIASIDHLADDSTTLIAMKGVTPIAELAALPASWEVLEVRDLHVPFINAQRCAVVLRRAS